MTSDRPGDYEMKREKQILRSGALADDAVETLKDLMHCKYDRLVRSGGNWELGVGNWWELGNK